eukprot:TRINITY_DN4376_c0_g1_i3.p1 TRINITY_DN4376_c0_g1~~TRINITY_DN4376_c0_g1_i3.p1  ORF type:complete len:118 (-),score=20.11 TRINITY_DN4376_c0_g1_i3:126-479(-)
MTDVSLSSHCLDISVGRAAKGLKLKLLRKEGGYWNELAEHRTNDDGRVTKDLFGSFPCPGTYQIIFHTKEYFETNGVTSYLYAEIPVIFEVSATLAGSHLHIPLLLSPFGYSTYRGT